MSNGIWVRDPGVAHLPPRWSNWQDLFKEGYPTDALGFDCSQAHLNRFAARFRLANAYRGIMLEDYSEPTVQGYSALFHLFLTWTAFEQYLKAFPCAQDSCRDWFDSHIPAGAADKIRALDEGRRLFGLIYSKANKKVRENIQAFWDGDDFNFTYLASSVRHIFAHGILTPHASGADPAVVATITTDLSQIHLWAVAADFKARVERLL